MTPSADDDVILIVDDNPEVRESFMEVLADSSYRAVGAANGQEALDLLSNGLRPCVILLDMMMPVMDGQQFRALQQRDAALAHIPVVVVSAHGNVEKTANELRAAGYLRKPLDASDLVAAVNKYCVCA